MPRTAVPFAHVSTEEVQRLDDLYKVVKGLSWSADAEATLAIATRSLHNYLVQAIGSATHAKRVFTLLIAAPAGSEAYTLGVAYAFGYVGGEIESEWAKADAEA